MLLYDSSVSGNCYKVRLLAAQLGLELERRELSVVDRSNRPEVLGGLNPALRVPTLVLDDGQSLGESNAILCYLAEGTEMVPSERLDHARMLQWMFFEQYDIEPNLAVVRFWVNYSSSPPAQSEIDARLAAGHRSLEAMERHLSSREFLVAERYTLADIALYAYTHVVHEGGFEMARYEAIARWMERVAAQPGHITIDA